MSNDIIQSGGNGDLIHVLKGAGEMAPIKPFSNDIELLKIHVAGTTHVENIREIEPTLTAETKLRFFREPSNEYDSHAIAIHTEAGQRIGYIPQVKNEILSKLLDGGKLVYGMVKDKHWEGNWLKIDVSVFLGE